MLLLFTLLLFVAIDAYDVISLNDFSADVDIYDMGTMGRGKNACSWHRSTTNKQEVFYYLAMQPWRHLVWTDCTGTECYKFFINEDASSVPAADGKTKLQINTDNDYCRKEYANPLPTFDIDWDQINKGDRLESIDVNGNTCYKYPAKQPLAHIYLRGHFTESKEVTSIQPCRYDFIGGKSITFRSFNTFSSVFIGNDKTNGYAANKTRCNIDPSPNNVQTDLAIILGIADTNVVQTINGALSKLQSLTTVKQVKVYYISGNSLKRETVALDNLASLGLKQVTSGPIDALINTAKNDLIARVNSKEIYRGTIIALMDRSMTSTFDAETAFDRNNITVHTVLYNPRGDVQMRVRARTLLSVGDHYHEFTVTTSAGISAVVDELFIGIRTNLTERCSRMTCNGFCDGRDRCTCPMCCENTCFFTYCNTTTATCMPWPEAKPKEKITCKEDCVGKQECIDLQGCVYTKYNEGCAPRAKCMKPYCDDDDFCQQKSSCEADTTPSYNNRCWNYTCNENNGNCERTGNGGKECPKLTDLCHEYYCDANLDCKQRAKTCVKTAPFVEMDCYKAQCNKKTGICENVLNCNDAYAAYTGCGNTEGISLSQCTCNAANNFKCSCSTGKVDTTGFCKSDEICDSSDETKDPSCKKSKCNQDLYQEGCEIKTCNEDTGEIEWVEYDCESKVVIDAVVHENLKDETDEDKKEQNKADAIKYCKEKFEIYCDSNVNKDKEGKEKNDKCFARQKEGISLEAGCGSCYFNETSTKGDDGKKHYTYSYYEDCSYLKVTCPDGNEIENSNTWYKEGKVGICVKKDEEKDLYECAYNELNASVEMTPYDRCAEACFSGVECYAATEFREYTFDSTTGQCDMFIVNEENIPGCSVCNEDKNGYKVTCTGSEPKIFEYTLDGQKYTFNYEIPYVCGPANQCIPDPFFDCGDFGLNPEIGDLLHLFRQCAKDGGISYEYHYSNKFDLNRYNTRRSQSQDFMSEMKEKAYCTYEFEMDFCKLCSAVDNKSIKLEDKCDILKKQVEEDHKKNGGAPLDSYTFKCNEFTNSCEKSLVSGNCTAKECSYFYWDTNKEGSDKCVNASIHTCTEYWNLQKTKLSEHEKVKAQMKHDIPVFAELSAEHEKDIFMQCFNEVKCQDDKDEFGNQLNCTYDENSYICAEAYRQYIEENRDFGCRIPQVDCNYDALICTFIDIIAPENDTRYFQDRDGVVFGDNCYNYTCQEYVNVTTGMIEHHWVLTAESVKELTMEPETICDTVHCDSVTGKSVSERRQCNPIVDYGLSERMAQCFECSCSMQTGENVLTMRPNTETTTYELDACGNCVVKDRATGNQINEVVECVLAQPVNLTGAIAGATVAASVVFGLIGSMVVVSIGALQTYQLVSSAMKNVISTTLENPEFVAADNEATNVLNNGD